jgi:transcriptional regulator with XRE-family HTH domain
MYFSVNTQILITSSKIQYMTNLADLIRTRRLALNLSQAELARRAGVTQGTIGHLESGRSNATTKLPQIAKALGISVESLIQNKAVIASYGAKMVMAEALGEIPPIELPTKDGLIWKSVCECRVGPDGTSVEWVKIGDERFHFSRSFFEKRGVDHNLCGLMQFQADSMEPWVDKDGILMVDTDDHRLLDGATYVMRFDDEIYVKQVFKQPGGGLLLHAHNRKYPDVPVPADSLASVTIVGKVIWRAS